MHLITITRDGAELARCLVTFPHEAHDVIGHGAYINWGGAGAGLTAGTTPDGRAFTIERVDSAPAGVARYESVRLFEPAPTQIRGQLSL